MNRNPYAPPANATDNDELLGKAVQARNPSMGKRLLFWFLGFVLMFFGNVIVEAIILPRWALENTPKNDIYFQIWWLLVVGWLVFGIAIISACQQTNTAR